MLLKLDGLGLHGQREGRVVVSNRGRLVETLPNDWDVVEVLNCALQSARYLSQLLGKISKIL